MAVKICPACGEVFSGETCDCPKCGDGANEKRPGKPRRNGKERRKESMEPADDERRDDKERRSPDERRKFSY